MPDRNARVKENVSGPFYVDSTCINCDVGRDLAPENFLRSFKHAYSYVSKQPENETERLPAEKRRLAVRSKRLEMMVEPVSSYQTDQ
jgi:ferredoxin